MCCCSPGGRSPWEGEPWEREAVVQEPSSYKVGSQTLGLPCVPGLSSKPWKRKCPVLVASRRHQCSTVECGLLGSRGGPCPGPNSARGCCALPCSSYLLT